MFLLLLMGLGAASVKAQVRIGGNTAPSKAAVLDLNATDAANAGTGGLVLPRVDLTSNTMPLTTGVANLTGMLVYNTTATLGAGIYFWNGSRWVLTSLPAATTADSSRTIMYTPTGWKLAQLYELKSYDFVLSSNWAANTYLQRSLTGVWVGICVWWQKAAGESGIGDIEMGTLTLYNGTAISLPTGLTIGVRCLGST